MPSTQQIRIRFHEVKANPLHTPYKSTHPATPSNLQSNKTFTHNSTHKLSSRTSLLKSGGGEDGVRQGPFQKKEKAVKSHKHRDKIKSHPSLYHDYATQLPHFFT